MAIKQRAGIHKIIWTIALIGLLLTTLLSWPREMVFENPAFSRMDSKATEYIDAGLMRASAAFILARSINSVVSVFQESELQLEPGGVGVSVALGQVLDPINDMVERFSWVMLACVTSLGIQKILIEVGPWFSINIVLALGLFFLLADLWIGKRLNANLRRAGGALVLFAILIRFAVPAMTFLNNQVYVKFLNDKYTESSMQLVSGQRELDKYNPDDIALEQQLQEEGQKGEVQQNPGIFKRTKNFIAGTYQNGKELLDIRGKFESIKNITLGMFDHFVNLIVVFLLNTVLLPLLFLWLFLKLGRLLIGHSFGQRAELFLKRKVVAERVDE